MAKRYTFGNNSTKGFVNVVEGNRITVGTGSYQTRDGERVYKESISVFFDKEFKGTMPVKGNYVHLIDMDLTVTERKDKAGEYSAAYNVRFANQIAVIEEPKKREAPASQPQGEETDI